MIDFEMTARADPGAAVYGGARKPEEY